MYSDQQYPSYPMDQFDNQDSQPRSREPGFIFVSHGNPEPGFQVPPQALQEPSYYTPPPNEQYTDDYPPHSYSQGANDYPSQQNNQGFDYNQPAQEIQTTDGAYNTRTHQEQQDSGQYKPQQIEPVSEDVSGKYGYSQTSSTQQNQSSDADSCQENEEKGSDLWKILCCGLCAYTCYECCCWCC